jgi:hypothetical protein
MEGITCCSDKLETFFKSCGEQIQLSTRLSHGVASINAYILYAIILVNASSYLSKFGSGGRKSIERSI